MDSGLDVALPFTEVEPSATDRCDAHDACTCDGGTGFISFADSGRFVYRHSLTAQTPAGVEWDGLAQGSAIEFDTGRYKQLYQMTHELAHRFTMDHRVGGNAVAVAAGWLYFDDRVSGTCDAGEIYADTLTNLIVPDSGIYLSSRCSATSLPPGTADRAVVESISSLQVPQWFYDTYSDDGTAAGVDLVELWTDIKGLDKAAVAAYGLRDSFGGFCSEQEAVDGLSATSTAGHPWVNGGCNNRRPQGLAAAAGSNSGEIDVTWSAPLWSTTPTIEAYVVQWKTGTGTYNSTDSATVSDLADLAHTITGLMSSATYSVRVAAVNSTDTAVFTDVDNRDRTAETTAIAP